MELENWLKKAANIKVIENVILIANVNGRTLHYNRDPKDLYPEFFHEYEYEYILCGLRKKGYKVLCYFDENKFISDYLNNKIVFSDYIVFNLARNGYGISKKALIPTFCDLNNIKYTGSDGYGVSIARNKFHTEKLLLQNNLNGIESWLYNGVWNEKNRPYDNLEVIIKPQFESASKGVTSKSIMNTSDKDFKNKVEEIFSNLQCTLVIEKFIRGFEAKIPLFRFDKVYAMPPVGVSINGKKRLESEILTDEIAFSYNHVEYDLAEIFDENIIDDIKQKSIEIYELLNLGNYGRIDCRIEPSGTFYFYDFSTSPYFVSDSELNFAFKLYKMDIEDILMVIINSALVSKYNYSL